MRPTHLPPGARIRRMLPVLSWPVEVACISATLPIFQSISLAGTRPEPYSGPRRCQRRRFVRTHNALYLLTQFRIFNNTSGIFIASHYKVLKRRHSELAHEINRTRVKRPRRADRLELNPHADDNKPQSQTPSPGIKLTEEFPTLNGEMKYTLIDCTAETLQSSGSTRIVRKERGRESEKHLMNGQYSGSLAQKRSLNHGSIRLPLSRQQI